MAKKKIINPPGLVYSTDPGLALQADEQAHVITLPAEDQKLIIALDKKHRAGKVVTLLTGFEGKENDIQELAKQLKTFCGTGGSVKEKTIIIQGDSSEKILHWLKNNGYRNAKNLMT
jgi:translation initiation factor 1